MARYEAEQAKIASDYEVQRRAALESTYKKLGREPRPVAVGQTAVQRTITADRLAATSAVPDTQSQDLVEYKKESLATEILHTEAHPNETRHYLEHIGMAHLVSEHEGGLAEPSAA